MTHWWLTQFFVPLARGGWRGIGCRARHEDAYALPLQEITSHLSEAWPDPGALAQQHNLPLALVLRRLAALPVDVAPGPAGLLIADGAGALTFRRPLDGFPLPRIGAGCPLWPLFEALQRPGQPIKAVVELPGPLARRFQTYAAVRGSAPRHIHAAACG